MKLYEKINIKLKNIEKPKYVKWSEKNLLMIDDIIKNEGKLKKPIRISKDNKIIDGNHRYSVLIGNYGEEFETEVIKINVTKNLYLTLIILIFPVLIPIGIINIIFFKKQRYE